MLAIRPRVLPLARGKPPAATSSRLAVTSEVDASPVLADLFAAHHARVFRAAYRVTGDEDDAADALQAVFLNLLRRQGNAGRLDGFSGAYLQRAAVNAALDILRARRRRRVIPIDDSTEADLGYQGATAADPLDPAELPDYLRQALTRLAPRAAEMFVLHHFEGLSNGEIAALFGTTANVVGVTLHRTRAELRDDLSAQLGGK